MSEESGDYAFIRKFNSYLSFPLIEHLLSCSLSVCPLDYFLIRQRVSQDMSLCVTFIYCIK